MCTHRCPTPLVLWQHSSQLPYPSWWLCRLPNNNSLLLRRLCHSCLFRPPSSCRRPRYNRTSPLSCMLSPILPQCSLTPRYVGLPLLASKLCLLCLGMATKLCTLCNISWWHTMLAATISTDLPVLSPASIQVHQRQSKSPVWSVCRLGA